MEKVKQYAQAYCNGEITLVEFRNVLTLFIADCNDEALFSEIADLLATKE